jgi:hypothetical protein
MGILFYNCPTFLYIKRHYHCLPYISITIMRPSSRGSGIPGTAQGGVPGTSAGGGVGARPGSGWRLKTGAAVSGPGRRPRYDQTENFMFEM